MSNDPKYNVEYLDGIYRKMEDAYQSICKAHEELWRYQRMCTSFSSEMAARAQVSDMGDIVRRIGLVETYLRAEKNRWEQEAKEAAHE